MYIYIYRERGYGAVMGIAKKTCKKSFYGVGMVEFDGGDAVFFTKPCKEKAKGGTKKRRINKI